MTHVVANRKGTLKLTQAKKIPGVFIVKPAWLFDSLAKWRKQDEEKYILEENLSSKKLLIRIEQVGGDSDNTVEQVDAHDFEILSAKPSDNLFAHLADDDLLEMDREVEEAMNEDDSESDSIGNEIDEGLDELFSAETENSPSLSVDLDAANLKRKRAQTNEIIDGR